MSGENDQNALWHYRNSHNKKFRVLAGFKHAERGLACEEMPLCEIRFVAVKEMTTTRSGNMKIPQRVMVFSFYSHDAIWDKL